MTSIATANEKPAPKKTIAVWYPGFMGGGAEAVALWILEALKERYDLTLCTIADVDFDRLNAMYGTQLSSEVVKVKCLSPPWLEGAEHFAIANFPAARKLSFHWLLRDFKTRTRDYDLVLSAYNAIDFGCPGMQYIHWAKVVEGGPLYHKLSDFSRDRLKENVSLANSQYTAAAVKKHYGIETTIVYPPVLLQPLDRPWAEKENAFICSGRLTKAKEPHRVIEIIREVRKRGFDLKLYLTGGGGGTYALKYKRFLSKFVAENSDWVTVSENLKYQDYIDILSRCKYGIHYKKEPFGISIAEMLKAGAIPFVRSIGGQREIIGEENQALFFDNPQDGVDKIVRILEDAELRDKTLERLRDRQSIFSAERFMSEIQMAVDNYW